MLNTLTASIAARTTAFALAAMVTLSMLGGVDQLAAPQAGSDAVQVDARAEQTVTITATRLTRS